MFSNSTNGLIGLDAALALLERLRGDAEEQPAVRVGRVHVAVRRDRHVVHEPALAGREAADQAAARERVDEDPVGQAAGHDQPVAGGVDPVGEQAPVLAGREEDLRLRAPERAAEDRAVGGGGHEELVGARAHRHALGERRRHPGGRTPSGGRSPRGPRRARRAGPGAGRVSRRRAYPEAVRRRRYPQSGWTSALSPSAWSPTTRPPSRGCRAPPGSSRAGSRPATWR